VTAAVILAGGAARRWGGAIKPLLPVGDATVLDRQLAALAAAGIRDVALSVGAAPASALMDAADRRGLPTVLDRIADRGPLAGVAAALAWSPDPALIVVAGDLPDVSPALIARLATALATADAVVPRIGAAIQPLLAGYRTSCAPIVEARVATGALRARELPAALVAVRLFLTWIDEPELRAIDPDLRSFTNWNRPSDRS
jgi:molybdopterin-guanine dinucleotide biosynthesis protein A